MRDYKEVTDAVLRRRDEQIAKDKRRAVIIKRCAAAAAACFAAAVVGTGVVKHDRNIFTQPEITNVPPTEITTSSDDKSITTTYKPNSDTKITTALTETAAENTRYRAEKIVTSSAKNDAICTVTSMNKRADTVCQSSAGTSSVRTAAQQTADMTETQVIVPLHEERVDMQRIPAFLSALTASMSAVIPNSNTEYLVNNDRYPNQKNGIENIRRGELLTDLNADGSFDLTDCLMLSLYCMDSGEKGTSDNGIQIPKDVSRRIADCADYNGDGTIGYDDAYVLICDYLLNNRIKYNDVDPKSYDPSFNGSINLPWIYDSNETSFARMVSDLSHQLLLDRYIIEDMVNKNIIDLDVNEDGITDIVDFAYLKINGENYLDSYIVPVEGGFATAPRPHTIELPENIRENCDTVYYARPFMYYDNSYEVSRFISGLEDYFASHMILMPEYFENDYYEGIIRYAGEYTIGDNLYHSAVEIGVIPENDSYFRFDNDIFENGFKAYYENVLSGKQKAPDLNKDGKTDRKDYDLAYAYIFEVAANNDEDSLDMPVSVWNNINTNCDFNQNGTSGDIYDIFIVQMYVLLTEEPSTNGNSGNDSLINEGSSSDTELYCSGDVNCDGVVDMADAVMIMQYLSNPSKFPISDCGRINGNVSESGYGITVSDVTAIQQYLLNNNQSIN